MKFHIKDNRYPTFPIKEINENEFISVMNFSGIFKMYEGVFYAYMNYHIAKKSYIEFKQKIESTNFSRSLEEVQRSSIYPITTLIIFINTFIDNAQKFSKMINSIKLKETIDKKYNVTSAKILRAARNYAIHSSIPVKGSKGIYDVLNKTQRYEFYIKKDEVSRDAYKNDRLTLEELDLDVIMFEPLFNEIENEIEALADKILVEFVKIIPEDVIQVMYRHIRYYRDKEGIQYFPSTFIKSERFMNNGYTFKEGIHLDSEVLKIVISTLDFKDE